MKRDSFRSLTAALAAALFFATGISGGGDCASCSTPDTTAAVVQTIRV